MKRGQIAIYVIVALLIVAAIGAFVYLRQRAAEMPSPSDDIQSIKIFVDSCLKSTAEEAIFFIGSQGGYYYPAQISAGSIAVYSYNRESLFPGKEIIENQISIYINDNIGDCLDNFSRFQDYSITEGNPSTKTSIIQNKVVVDLTYPITITRLSTSRLERFGAEVPSRLFTIINVSQLITADTIQYNKICLSCVLDYGYDNEVHIDMENMEYDAVAFTITDSKIPLRNQPYQFTFVNKY
jgi:hypothetical protein